MSNNMIDFILNDAMYGGGGGANNIAGLPVDGTSINDGSILVAKDGIWQGMLVAEILGNPELLKGEDGFTPIPIFRTDNGKQYLKFQIGEDAYRSPIYSVETEMISIQKSSKPIDVIGKSIGSYNAGDVIPIGTSLEDIIQNIVRTISNPTYVNPTLSIGGSSPLNPESGTVSNITISPTFIQNDAGPVTQYKVFKNGSLVLNTSSVQNYTDSSVLIRDDPIVYRVEISYASGPIKKNNVGNDYPTGRIQAGTLVSGNVTYQGLRKAFYGTTNANKNDGSTSNEIRTLTQTTSKADTGTTFNISIPVGATKIIFAYPSHLRDVSNVLYSEGMNADIKSVFKQSKINVYGASSYNPIEYKVYTYVPVVPISDDINYKIII